MLPPEHRSCGDGKKSIHAGFSAIKTLHTHPPNPPAKHLSISLTAFPTSIDNAWTPSVIVVPKFVGQILSHIAQFAGMSMPLREVRAKRSHFAANTT